MFLLKRRPFLCALAAANTLFTGCSTWTSCYHGARETVSLASIPELQHVMWLSCVCHTFPPPRCLLVSMATGPWWHQQCSWTISGCAPGPVCLPLSLTLAWHSAGILSTLSKNMPTHDNDSCQPFLPLPLFLLPSFLFLPFWSSLLASSFSLPSRLLPLSPFSPPPSLSLVTSSLSLPSRLLLLSPSVTMSTWHMLPTVPTHAGPSRLLWLAFRSLPMNRYREKAIEWAV